MKRIITLTVLFTVAIIVWWSTTKEYGETQQSQPSADDRYVEIYMNAFEITSMDESGLPAYKLNGSQLKKYNDTDDTEIQQPVLQLLRHDTQGDNDGDGQWRISADTAFVNNKKETIQLQKNVIMQQINTDPAVTIRTQNMLINTRTQIARTSAQVDITQGNSHLTAKGMIYNNISSELELSSRVNGHYLR